MDADASTPLLYALRNDLELNGPRFGCGLAQCAAPRSNRHERGHAGHAQGFPADHWRSGDSCVGASARVCPGGAAPESRGESYGSATSIRISAGPGAETDTVDPAGRGGAFARYKNTSAYLAVVVDVSVNEGSGAVRLHRAFAAVDVGQVINPDGVRNQIEGGIIQSASWTLRESVRFSASGIESVDWNTYPILRFEDIPEVEVALVNRPELPPSGAGEAAQGPTSAAIANAVADATGARIRDLPLTPERVSAALASWPTVAGVSAVLASWQPVAGVKARPRARQKPHPARRKPYPWMSSTGGFRSSAGRWPRSEPAQNRARNRGARVRTSPRH